MKNKDIVEGIVDAVKENIREMTIEASNEVIDTIKNKSTTYLYDKIEAGRGELLNKSSGEHPSNDSISSKIISQELQSSNIVKVTANMTEEQENNFLENISSEFMKTAVINNISNPQIALESVKHYITTAGEVIKFCEIQETKRTEIESHKQQALAYIDMQKQILMTYLNKTFDERKEIFSQYFKVVDDALQKGNMDELVIGLNNINRLATSSPFKNLENVQKALKDSNTVWEF